MGKTSLKSNGGILGSGIYGLFGSTTTVVCQSTDNSIYCSIMKILNIIIGFISILLIIYFLYLFIQYYLFTRK